MALTSLAACRREHNNSTLESAYYWSTTLQMDSAKRTFRRAHQVKRLYIRFFDIVMSEDNGPVHNATLRFDAVLPDTIEVVPTYSLEAYVLSQVYHNIPHAVKC